MTAIKTREFSGFQIENSNSFVMTLNSRQGPVELNCQEVMAIALEKNAIFGNGQADNDIVQITGNSYNIISQLRSSETWILAKNSFETLNPTLTDSQKSKIQAKKSNGNTGNNSSDKIKFTATNASNLGKAIFESLPVEYKKYLSNFDKSNTDFWSGNRKDLLESAIDRFQYSIKADLALLEYEKRVAEKKQAEQAEQERIAKIESKALAMLKVMGVSKESKDYQEKLQGIMIILDSE